ncbi:hypothetical protein GCM10027091_63410 [Streptomyces daliensis]
MVAAPMESDEAPEGAKLAAVPVVPHSAAAASTSSGPEAARGALEGAGEPEGEGPSAGAVPTGRPVCAGTAARERMAAREEEEREDMGDAS